MLYILGKKDPQKELERKLAEERAKDSMDATAYAFIYVKARNRFRLISTGNLHKACQNAVYREVEILGPSASPILARVQGKIYRGLDTVDRIRVLWYAWNWENAIDIEIIK